MKRFLCIFLSFLFVLPLFACGDYDEQEEENPFEVISDYYEKQREAAKEATIDSFSLPFHRGESLNPYSCSDGIQLTITSLLYDSLYSLDTSFNIIDDLAESYTYEDHMYIIRLKDNVRFSDGSYVTGQDLEASIDRARYSTRYGDRLSNIYLTNGRDRTIEITVDQDNANFISCLNIPIVKSGTEYDTYPIGTGPYLFVNDGSNSHLSKNPYYWNDSESMPSTISLINCRSQDSVLFSFSSNNVHFVSLDLLSSKISSIPFGAGSYYKMPTSIMLYLGANTVQGPLANKELRRAFSNVLDRNSLISTCLNGYALAAQFPISPLSENYPDNLDESPSIRDYENTLSSLGYNTGLEKNTVTIRLLVNEENTFKVSLANTIAESLSRCDISIEVLPLPFESFQYELSNGNFDLYLAETKLTTDWDITELISSDGSLNFGRYYDYEMEQKQQNSLSSVSIAHNTSTFSLYTYFKEELPFIPICFKSTSLLVPSGIIDNVVASPDNPFYNFGDWNISFSK